MRLFTPLAVAAGAVALSAGLATAPAQAAAPQSPPARVVFNCAEAGPVPLIYPPWVNGLDCTPPLVGHFQNVQINFPHGDSWRCAHAQSRPGRHPGFVDVLGKDCRAVND
ncbi:hypothetical protein [Actinomadura terrae]|uniref:hypothetical protein n=1 Tax=Actinomadura terrae TaxID=604353 RepID=UPI001FA73B9D|nr:hypothetical protein [Actinomadura terrae]